MTERFFLYDDMEQTRTRFVSFMGEHQRYDLALMQTDRYYGKKLVLDIQGGRFAIIGQDDLEEPCYLEEVFKLSDEEAAELRDFLSEVI
ncbi:cytosolic protein [Bacillaceae bacterium SAOS 7]|nr:cytosolic protein [Bacillaceae bacterium SAOS 7]